MLKKITSLGYKKIILFLILLLAGFLRLYSIDKFPPSPYWEEVALGYDAYSIKETLRDHHGNFLPIIAFESFGDWKPSLYFYSIVPFLYLFDLSILAVRAPSIIAGIFIVLGIYKLAKRFEVNPVIAGILAAISPWAIIFSRAAWEVNLATALILWGVIFGLRGIEDKNRLKTKSLILSLVLFSLSTYTYHSARVIAPLLFVGLLGLHYFENYFDIKKPWISIGKYFSKFVKQVFPLFFLLVIFISPLIISLGNESVSKRFAETSIFSNLDIIIESNQNIEASDNSLFSRVIYHRYILFSREIIKNFISHFNFNFLFLTGDQNPRHSTGLIGQLYHVEIVFLLLGLFFFIKKFKKKYLFLLFWMIIGVLPASVTKTVPHALRILSVMPIFILIIAKGMGDLLKEFRNSKKIKHLAILLIVLIYFFEFCQFWKFYSIIYPQKYSNQWQYGYQEMIDKVNNYSIKNEGEKTYITREQGRPAMYYFFFSKIDPRRVQLEEEISAKDQGEILSFENISFVRNLDSIKSSSLVASSEKLYYDFNLSNKTEKLDEVKDLDSSIIWIIFKFLE